ncbi:MAG: hypothetical protein ACLR47_12090 [Ruminococcus bicirculans (ex Wegman et al. 2014)]|uniref:hypothetical protein n=1 Tax=Ruminococcus TaxID=1263 RepID=UPI00399FD14C
MRNYTHFFKTAHRAFYACYRAFAGSSYSFLLNADFIAVAATLGMRVDKAVELAGYGKICVIASEVRYKAVWYAHFLSSFPIYLGNKKRT